MRSMHYSNVAMPDTLCIMHDTTQLQIAAICACTLLLMTSQLTTKLTTCWSFVCRHLLSVCSGYGFYRPQVTLFDPGWRGEQTKGPEDSEWGVVDLGNDPATIVERFLLLLCHFVTTHIILICLPVNQAHVSDYAIITCVTVIIYADAVMQVY